MALSPEKSSSPGSLDSGHPPDRICLSSPPHPSSTRGSSLKVSAWGHTHSLCLHILPPSLSCAVLHGRGRCSPSLTCPATHSSGAETGSVCSGTEGQNTLRENPAPRASAPGYHTPVWGFLLHRGTQPHASKPTPQVSYFTSSLYMSFSPSPRLANSPLTATERPRTYS